MRANALYFPYIALPDDAWTVKSLLYWDRLSSIVPMDHMTRPDQMSDFMRELLTEGLVEPVIPAQYIHHVRSFDESFIKLIEQRLRRNYKRSGPALSPRATTRIHVEKLGEIPHFLVESGLAEQVDGVWFDVETPTANLFMSYLAACLGAVPEVNATPVTNKVVFAAGLNSSLSRSVRPLHHHKSREVVLQHLLPTPTGQVELDKLVRFKRQHGHLLPPLRAQVEAHCAYVATLPDANGRVEANEAFLLSCKSRIAEIEDAMRPSFGDIVFGSLVPLGGAGLSLYATDPSSPAGRAGAALTLTNVIYQAINSMRGDHALTNRPLAYVAHAQHVFG